MISHVLINMDNNDFAKLCRMVIERPRYRGKCTFRNCIVKKSLRFYNLIVEFVEKVPESSTEVLNQNEFLVTGYPCTQYISKTSSRKTFKIMNGPDETSVIIIEPVIRNNKSCYVPVELIENLEINYIRKLEDYF